MLLFLDTETNGLPDFNKRASDPSQPHIAQLAAQLCDENGNIVSQFETITKPDGWTITPELSAIHGITHEMAEGVGLPEKLALEVLLPMIRKADLIVAFNCQFDKFMARIGMRRFGLLTDDMDQWWKDLKTFCPMREMTDVCQLPATRGGKFKFPKLQEAYFHCFGKEFEGAHTAMADVEACKSVYFWLTKKGVAA